MNKPKDKFSLEQDLACSASEYAYENEDTDFECVAKIKMTHHGATAEIIDGFTLTAEEVEMIEPLVEEKLSHYEQITCQYHHDKDSREPFVYEMAEWFRNLLTRIKQWQDEQSKRN